MNLDGEPLQCLRLRQAEDKQPGSRGHEEEAAVELWEDDCPSKEKHEVELEEGLEGSVGGPVTSHRCCKKHPGHKDFVAISDFGVDKVDNVPHGLSKEEFVDLVLSCAGLVCRIEVKFVSGDRPETKYPLSEFRGLKVVHTGSGWIVDVRNPEEDQDSVSGDADEEARTSEVDKYWTIRIQTARHVVFDDGEARTCQVVVFDDCPDGSGSHRLEGSRVTESHTARDWSTLVCYTRDKCLAVRLQGLVEKCGTVVNRMNRVWKNGRDGLHESVREKTLELCRRYREVRDRMKERGVKLRQSFDEIDSCMGQRLDELRVRVTQDGTEIGSRVLQILANLSIPRRQNETDYRENKWWKIPGTMLEEIEGSDSRVFLENLSDRLNGVVTDDTTSANSVSELDWTDSSDRDDEPDRLHETDRLDETDTGSHQSLRQLWASHDKIKRRVKRTHHRIDMQEREMKKNLIALFSDRSLVHPTVVVISHPHGRMKYITIGHSDHLETDLPLTYKVATCPGSSGGLVLVQPTCPKLLLEGELGPNFWLRRVWPLHSNGKKGMWCISHRAARSSQVGVSNVTLRVHARFIVRSRSIVRTASSEDSSSSSSSSSPAIQC